MNNLENRGTPQKLRPDSRAKAPQWDVVDLLRGEKSVRISRLVALFLASRGIDRVFGLCGGHIQPIWDEVARLGIRIIDVRDERASVYMAQAHSELTGEIGVALVTAGPGLTNALTGIANASVSRVPILVISGCPPRPQQSRGALQEIPQVEIVTPVSRYAKSIRLKEQTLRELDEAIESSREVGRGPGPAYLEFPTDLLREEMPVRGLELERLRRREPSPLLPHPEDIEKAVEILWGAGRLVVISGRGARGSRSQILELLDALECAYLDTSESRALVPEDHPSFVPSMRGRVMEEADVVLTLGRCLDAQLGYGSKALFPRARFVRIGSSPAELRGNRRGEVEIFGTVPEVLSAIVELGRTRIPTPDRGWMEAIRAEDRKKRANLEALMSNALPGSDGRMHPYRLLGCIREALSQDAIVVADGGDILSFARVALSGFNYLDPGLFGCLGVGVPFGIAAALAFPDRQVLVVTGDGAFGFTGMELDSARRHNARVVFVIANNEAWNIERYDQIQSYEGRVVGTELQGPNYAAMARALGIYGERVEEPEDLPGALKRALDRAPALLEVPVTREAISPDARSGLAWVPDTQPLATWEQMERLRE